MSSSPSTSTCHIVPMESPKNPEDSQSNYPKRTGFLRHKLALQVILFIFFAVLLFFLILPRRPSFLSGLSESQIREFESIFGDSSLTEDESEKALERWALDLPDENNLLWWQWQAARKFALLENRNYHAHQREYIQGAVARSIDAQILPILDNPKLSIFSKYSQLSQVIDEAQVHSPLAFNEMQATYLMNFDKLLCFYSANRLNCDFHAFTKPTYNA